MFSFCFAWDVLPFRCAELLVVKAELEMMKGEREQSGFDLDAVTDLLELCTGQSTTQNLMCKKCPFLFRG